MQLAIALYNNNVDDDDELEFRKGDILTVLIENPHGFEGWWLCKHKDKCGLCPGNRLKLIQNSNSSPVQINDYLNSRFSTISMYDGLSSNHDYDNPHQSDFITDLKPIDSSPESSSRSSGIYSANELHLSCSSSDLYSTNHTNNKSFSSFELDQLEKCFQKLSIHSKLISSYRQFIFQSPNESNSSNFLHECHRFLQNYGCLLDRSNYKLIKENLLDEFEHDKKHRIHLATKILQIIELRLKQKQTNQSSISNDIFRKLHLEPIEENPTEKLSTSHSANQISQKKTNLLTQQMKTSKTCHSNFVTSSNYDDYDYIDDDDDDNGDYSMKPLIKCYYRHINEQVNLIIKRYSFLLENENELYVFVDQGKKLVVSGQKLLFVLETLREHSQQIQTSLMHLKRQLCEALTNFIQLLKQISCQLNSINHHKNIIQFKSNIQFIMNIVKRIKQHCSTV